MRPPSATPAGCSSWRRSISARAGPRTRYQWPLPGLRQASNSRESPPPTGRGPVGEVKHASASCRRRSTSARRSSSSSSTRRSSASLNQLVEQRLTARNGNGPPPRRPRPAIVETAVATKACAGPCGRTLPGLSIQVMRCGAPQPVVPHYSPAAGRPGGTDIGAPRSRDPLYRQSNRVTAYLGRARPA